MVRGTRLCCTPLHVRIPFQPAVEELISHLSVTFLLISDDDGSKDIRLDSAFHFAMLKLRWTTFYGNTLFIFYLISSNRLPNSTVPAVMIAMALC